MCAGHAGTDHTLRKEVRLDRNNNPPAIGLHSSGSHATLASTLAAASRTTQLLWDSSSTRRDTQPGAAAIVLLVPTSSQARLARAPAMAANRVSWSSDVCCSSCSRGCMQPASISSGQCSGSIARFCRAAAANRAAAVALPSMLTMAGRAPGVAMMRFLLCTLRVRWDSSSAAASMFAPGC